VSELARLVQIDYAREMAFIATTQLSDGSMETLGVVRAVTDPDNVQAEFALLVRSDLKRQGLGRLLLARIIEYLRSRGTQRMVGEVMAENVAMRALVGSFGVACKRHPLDHTVVSCELDL
jgi:acetyltransferase